MTEPNKKGKVMERKHLLRAAALAALLAPAASAAEPFNSLEINGLWQITAGTYSNGLPYLNWRPISGGYPNTLSITPARLEFLGRNSTPVIQTVRVDPMPSGLAGRFQQQGLSYEGPDLSPGEWWNTFVIKSYVVANDKDAEESKAELSITVAGDEKRFLIVTKDTVELGAGFALKVNGSVGNPGDVLHSAGPGAAPYWGPP